MKNKHFILVAILILLSACSLNPFRKDKVVHDRPIWNIPPFNWVGAHGNGQDIFHWQRPHTGVQKFSTDHKFCIEKAKTFKLFPAIKKFYSKVFRTEEKHFEILADWNGKSGVWASFIPYAGAQPIMVNVPTREEDDDISPRKYVNCMTDRGYTTRNYEIPDVTNVYLRRQNDQ